MKRIATLALALALAPALAAGGELVRLGNLKFAHYGAVSYMKEHCRKFGLKVEEMVFPKGIDIFPAIVRGEMDLAASAADAAIADRAGGGQVYVVAGFARGGARLVGRADLDLRSVADLKGKKVGVARGGAQELLLLAELAKAGLTWSDKPGKDVQLVYLRLRRPQPGAAAEADRRHVPVGAAVLPGHQQGFRQGDPQALRHPAGRAGARPGDDREAVPRAAEGGARRS